MTLKYFPSASFPAAVWNGSNPNRVALHDIRAPNDAEARRIISEIVAVQQWLSEHNLLGYIFPAVDGAPGDILTTDGEGNLSWITPT
jgi:hypothetical protein